MRNALVVRKLIEEDPPLEEDRTTNYPALLIKKKSSSHNTEMLSYNSRGQSEQVEALKLTI